MNRISPAGRIAVGIVGLTLSLLLAADFFGLLGNGREAALEQRQRFVEMSALQLSMASERDGQAAVQSVLSTLVSRNPELLGVVLRRRDGVVLAGQGDYAREPAAERENTEQQMSLPLMKGRLHVGSIEFSFRPIGGEGPLGLPRGGVVGLALFMLLVGGVCYYLYLRRSLLYLDPSSVVPDRVRKALNVLNNGVMILDDEEMIVLVNDSFARKLGENPDALLGHRPSDLRWIVPDPQNTDFIYPWLEALHRGAEKHGVSLGLADPEGKVHTYLVNSSPILDADGKQRGVIVGLDDVTDLQHKNSLLASTVQALESSKKQVEEQNHKLHILATRDPMTNCHNRRSLYDTVTPRFTEAAQKRPALACIMTDIDHFKAVNDTYGHAAGDEIIKMVADVLLKAVGERGLVCRYGGEEFCIMLFDTGVFDANKLAEQCRQQIGAMITCGIKITSSFGVSSLSYGAHSVDALISQADQALYSSKERGRNCVTSWDAGMGKQGGDLPGAVNSTRMRPGA